MRSKVLRRVFISVAGLVACQAAMAQPETMAWSNLNGIRIEDQLMEFGTSLAVVEPDWSQVFVTGKERQTTTYSRNGKIETVKLQLTPRRERRDQPMPAWSFSAVQVVEDLGGGAARLDVQFEPKTDAEIAGAVHRPSAPGAAGSFAGRRRGRGERVRTGSGQRDPADGTGPAA